MKSIAVYSPKGGVGKTTLASSLAWASASLAGHSTLIWDLDPQGAASFLFDHKADRSRKAESVFRRDVAASKLIHPTGVKRLSLLPADRSLRNLNHFLRELGKKGRLAKLLDEAGKDFDLVVIDCPPGLTETSAQVLRAADLIIVPVIPSPLSVRALDELFEALFAKSVPRARTLPVFNMVDRRRRIHLETLAAHAGWPVVPMSSAFESMGTRRSPIGAGPREPAASTALAELWKDVEWQLTRH